jgi:YYY domain-containing protein
MLHFFLWYLVISMLGWLTFPLVYRLFPALSDRGYSLTRALGLLIWGYTFWLMVSLGIAQNNLGGLLLAFVILVGVGGWAIQRKTNDGTTQGFRPLFNWLKNNLRLIFTIEGLFILAFAFLAVIRAASPDITGTEKPMELAFINAILRSPTFPPRDPWLSGYAISYYYFGYVMTAMLAKITSVPGSVAFNLMGSLVFALSAVGAYGVVHNLLAAFRQNMGARHIPPLLGPLFLLIVSNIEGFLEILHRLGLFWRFSPDGSAASPFWNWLDIKELSQPPVQPFGWIPNRYWWWWRASRVVQDYTLSGQWSEIIDEFPFFSYLLADLHPHVLAMPFGLLAVASALNLFLGGWRGEMNIFGLRLGINRSGFLLMAILLGGLAFLNTWDILIAAALIAGAYVLARTHEDGWRWECVEDFFLLGLSLGITAFLLYLPFYFGFSSQASGIAPNLVNPTRGAHLWVMFAPLLLPIMAYLVYLWLGEKIPSYLTSGIGLTFCIILLLWGFSWLMGWTGLFIRPEDAMQFLQSQGIPDVHTLLVSATQRRCIYIGGLMTLGTLLATALAFLARMGNKRNTINKKPSSIINRPFSFVVLLILLGSLLVLVPDFIYLRDQFGTRMNTIFKFYYQAWLLWSLAAAFGAAVMLQSLRGVWEWLYSLGLWFLLIVALTYPAFGMWNKTSGFDPTFGWTLDGAAYITRDTPDEAAAIRWLQQAPDGIVAEAVGGSYTGYARIATHTGLPTVLGWPGHESQWRGGGAEMGSRMQDIETLYATPKWETAETILKQYNIRYVYIGALERITYRVEESKFERFLRPAFRLGDVVIYEVP